MAGNVTIRRQVSFTDDDGEIAATEIQHDFVAPSPTKHAQQLYPLLAERQQLPQGPRRQQLEDHLITLALRFAEALDQANQKFNPPAPSNLPAGAGPPTPNYAQQFQKYVDQFQQATTTADQQNALVMIFALGKGMAEAIDTVNRISRQPQQR